MKGRYPHLDWVCSDAKNMEFADDTFDLVIDKGLLDAIACNLDYSEPSDSVCVLKEMMRVLKPGKVLAIFSHSSLEIRKVLFRNAGIDCASILEESFVSSESNFYFFKITK